MNTSTICISLQRVTFALVCALVIGTGCTTRSTLNSAAQTGIAFDPLASDKVDVAYQRAAVNLEKRTIGGFLLGTNPKEVERTAVIDFQNGHRRGSINQSGLNLLAVITGLSAWYGIASALTESIDRARYPGTAPRESLRKDAALFAIPLALFENEAIWRFVNSRRLRSFGQQILIDQEESDFYCLPNESITIRRGLISTKWEYEAEMLTGKYTITE